ncbi:kinase-like protein [Backusella circina FSU 941]|nr:kinase-like protein [Backusella circina FSU 941]
MHHINIVSLIDWEKTDTHVYLVMEYCSMGDLSQFIKVKYECKGLPDKIVRHFLYQLASALKFLRENNLVHRDIKPQNLLLVPPSHGELPIVKVADFGFARILPNRSLADTLCGSPLYMAPEILEFKKYDAKADLWSVGTVLYEMMIGKPPFQAANQPELIKKINDTKDQITFPTQQSPDLVHLVKSLLKISPEERSDYAAFFFHPAISLHQSPSDDHWSELHEDEEYVVLDRESIETNQFDDELNFSTAHTPPRVQSRHSVDHTTTMAPAPILPIPMQQQRDRKFSMGSAGSALTKALAKASIRFFGSKSPPLTVNSTVSAEEQRTLRHIEKLIRMAHTVNLFAETKSELSLGNPSDPIMAQEAMLLHVKVLSILDAGIHEAKQYRENSNKKEISVRLNDAVQWMRQQFNQSLQNASLASERTDSSVHDVSVEKLLYDRALEMSRAAAVQELVGENLMECKRDYQQSIRLLEAILQVPDETQVEEEDRRIIKKFVDSIRHRLTGFASLELKDIKI